MAGKTDRSTPDGSDKLKGVASDDAESHENYEELVEKDRCATALSVCVRELRGAAHQAATSDVCRPASSQRPACKQAVLLSKSVEALLDYHTHQASCWQL